MSALLSLSEKLSCRSFHPTSSATKKAFRNPWPSPFQWSVTLSRVLCRGVYRALYVKILCNNRKKKFIFSCATCRMALHVTSYTVWPNLEHSKIDKPDLRQAILCARAVPSQRRVCNKTTSMAPSFADMSTRYEVELFGTHGNETAEQYVKQLCTYFCCFTHFFYGYSALSSM